VAERDSPIFIDTKIGTVPKKLLTVALQSSLACKIGPVAVFRIPIKARGPQGAGLIGCNDYNGFARYYFRKKAFCRVIAKPQAVCRQLKLPGHCEIASGLSAIEITGASRNRKRIVGN
jgi:hypothetical protein